MGLLSPLQVCSSLIPGTEGWERMYPPHYQFTLDPCERSKREADSFWLYDALHYPEAMYPFDTFWDEVCNFSLSQYNNRIFQMPSVRGIERRIINGYIYLSPVAVVDEEEMVQRLYNFRERAGFYYENWEELEVKWINKMETLIKELTAVDIPKLPDLEDISIVKQAIGESSGFNLLQSFDTLISLGTRCWQYHFEFLNLGYAAYVSFVDFLQQKFPSIPLPHITQMISGIDVIMYRPDSELQRLAQAALDLNTSEAVLSSSQWYDVEGRLSLNTNGLEWLERLEKARYPWFYVSTGTGWYHHHHCWNDDLNIPLAGIQKYIRQLQAGVSIKRPIDKIRAERDKITSNYRQLLESHEEKTLFDKFLLCARKVFPYVENHLFYVEHWFHSIFWNKIRDVGTIFLEYGIVNDIEDIWYMRRDEMRQVLWDIVTGWAAGVEPHGSLIWPDEIEWRQEVMNKFRAWNPPAAIGTQPDVIKDPFIIMLWGITNRTLAEWQHPPNEKTDSHIRILKGVGASPGLVTGSARVCHHVEDLQDVQDGEILVSTTISPSWAPVFTKIQACVAQVGGVMSHAAIVCREYGIPAVVGTGPAIDIIKTGMQIEVDGSSGIVRIDMLHSYA